MLAKKNYLYMTENTHLLNDWNCCELAAFLHTGQPYCGPLGWDGLALIL